MKSFNERVDHLQVTVGEIKSSLEFTQNQLDTFQQQQSDMVDKTESVSFEVDSAKKNLEDIRTKVDYVENQSRRNNLRFDGIPEMAQETWEATEEKVVKILKDNLGFQKTPAIERAHRTGSTSSNKSSRTVVVKFASYKDREAILRKRKMLKGTSIYVNEDLSDRVMERRRDQLDRLKDARSNGKIAYFAYDRLVIKERSSQPQSGPTTRSVIRHPSSQATRHPDP